MEKNWDRALKPFVPARGRAQATGLGVCGGVGMGAVSGYRWWWQYCSGLNVMAVKSGLKVLDSNPSSCPRLAVQCQESYLTSLSPSLFILRGMEKEHCKMVCMWAKIPGAEKCLPDLCIVLHAGNLP